ncbi:MAG: type II methionyl aminopeptidase [Nanoarchaeota archaeon]
MTNLDKQKILLAGKIAAQVREHARGFIKKGMSLLEIAERIESKMFELGGKPAFQTCLSIDDEAAHCTPTYDDKSLARGLLKIDMGVHIDGWIADTAFSLDLENSEENKKIILASEKALENAIKTIKNKVEVRRIGEEVYKTIDNFGLSPIVNLSGHSIEKYNLHAGVSIPNINNGDKTKIIPGVYAIEPFATNGNGKVYDGKPSGIYLLVNEKNIRSQIAREVLEFIKKEYKTIPFCSRWLVKNLGTKALIGLKQLEENGNLHHYAQLIEAVHGKVAQTEHTILVEENEIIVTTI